MARREVPMCVRRSIVEADVDGLNVTRFCGDHGVSPDTFYELRRRDAQEGPPGVQLMFAGAGSGREPHPGRGRGPDRGAAQGARPARHGRWPGDDPLLAAERMPSEVTVPSPARIWRVLSRRGFIVAEPAKRPGGDGGASRPNGPTSAGRWMTRTGRWPTAPRSRSSTSSMTARLAARPRRRPRHVERCGPIGICEARGPERLLRTTPAISA